MGDNKANKTRLLVLVLFIGVVLLSLFRHIYPLTDITEISLLIVLVSIIIAYIIEKFVFLRKK